MFLKISRGLFVVTALCSFVNGIAYLFFPVASLALLGVQPDGYGVVITRYYGACALGWGWLLWWASKSNSIAVLRAVTGSILLVLGISAGVGCQALRSGLFNQVGGIMVITDGMLAIFALLSLILVSRKSH
jgi:hypothetical protein